MCLLTLPFFCSLLKYQRQGCNGDGVKTLSVFWKCKSFLFRHLWNVSTLYFLLLLLSLILLFPLALSWSFKNCLVKKKKKTTFLDQNELENYCSLSNLSFVSKIIEKLVLSQLSDHLSAKNLCNRFQSAYRPGHSTNTALLNSQWSSRSGCWKCFSACSFGLVSSLWHDRS